MVNRLKPAGFLFIVALLLAGLAPLGPAGAQATTGLDKWALWQAGPNLRGANIYQRRSYPDVDGGLAAVGPVLPPYGQADFDRLAGLGANFVNISHPGLFTELPPYTVDPAIQANLDGLLAKIAQANLFAVISFRTGPGRNEFTFLNEEHPGWLGYSLDINFIWTNQAAQDGWVAMWRYAAERYRYNPVVAGYDLMVEPNSNVLLNLWDPADFYPAYAGSLYDWNQLHPRLSAAIRQVDPGTPILTGALGYSAVPWLAYLQPTADPRTVYTVHHYEPFVYTHQDSPLSLAYPGLFDADGDGFDEPVNQAWLDDFLSTVDTFKTTHQAPVAVNEYGVKRWQPGAAQYMADQMALFEQRGLNHSWWLWETSDVRFSAISDDFNLRFGPDPNHHQEVTGSDLLDVIEQNWQKNSARPNNQAKDNVFLPLVLK